eukprot:scaffold446814_cov46-Prasinocladus_malaysianus.AAC.1
MPMCMFGDLSHGSVVMPQGAGLSDGGNERASFPASFWAPAGGVRSFHVRGLHDPQGAGHGVGRGDQAQVNHRQQAKVARDERRRRETRRGESRGADLTSLRLSCTLLEARKEARAALWGRVSVLGFDRAPLAMAHSIFKLMQRRSKATRGWG